MIFAWDESDVCALVVELLSAEIVCLGVRVFRNVQLYVGIAFVPDLFIDLVDPFSDKATGTLPVCSGTTNAG
ncbi:hypothetical protein [Faecalibaculum rodentium]|uniref:hypothetical protein n=1 Tax=Faecalibaculum rodentium TaxID=1702221 RepID=UPI0026F3F349|nr:hypothetical protein [Faecalibaculum rodentium]